jgi:hypothetical protein
MPGACNKPEFGPCTRVAATLLTDWGSVRVQANRGKYGGVMTQPIAGGNRHAVA